jgi:hypothetical protein
VHISLLVLSAAVLLTGILWLLRNRGGPPRSPQGLTVDDSRGAHLQLDAADAWAFDHLCRSITTIVHERPGIRRVTIDLTRVRVLDPSSTALLHHALRELQMKGVETRLEVGKAPLARDVFRPAAELTPTDPGRRILH